MTLRKSTATILAILTSFPVSLAWAQDAAQHLMAGHLLAVDLCSACHALPGQPTPRLSGLDAPSFAEIANRPSTSAASLRAFMTSTHLDEHRMAMNSSNATLAPYQQDDLIDYILSLRSGR